MFLLSRVTKQTLHQNLSKQQFKVHSVGLFGKPASFDTGTRLLFRGLLKRECMLNLRYILTYKVNGCEVWCRNKNMEF